jgi:hypothetical protein
VRGVKSQISNLRFQILLAVVAGFIVTRPLPAAERHWPNGVPDRADFFPLCVWLQSPRNAERYHAIGINTYVALYRGPTDEQLSALEKAGMYAVLQQSERSLKYKDSKVIAAWMHGDEPDNAQPRGDRQPGWGPPIPAEKIVADYERIKAADPTRPVLLNLGQGVAWDNWHGRGVRSRHPEDYPQYLKGCDIASFDIYPVTHESPEVAGKLELVGYGVKRLREWTAGDKMVWACIETTHIHNEKLMPTPDQLRSEVWLALAHGANGIIYFCHEFKPRQIEAGLLEYPQIEAAVKAVNAEVARLAPVLNSPTVADAVTVDAAIATLCKRRGDATYVVAVSTSGGPTHATFSVKGLAPKRSAEALGENRKIDSSNGRFSDDFAPYAVHLYKIGG